MQMGKQHILMGYSRGHRTSFMICHRSELLRAICHFFGEDKGLECSSHHHQTSSHFGVERLSHQGVPLRAKDGQSPTSEPHPPTCSAKTLQAVRMNEVTGLEALQWRL